MKNLSFIFGIILLLTSLISACKEAREFESIVVRPNSFSSESEPICCPHDSDATCDNGSSYTAAGYRYFDAIGLYSDDSEEDLTDEVTWKTDSSVDVLSSTTKGLVWCNKQSDDIAFSITATYSLSTANSGSSSDSSNTYTDSIIIVVNDK